MPSLQAFLQTDAELAGTEVGELVGSTALVAVVGHSEVYLAHAGAQAAGRRGTRLAPCGGGASAAAARALGALSPRGGQEGQGSPGDAAASHGLCHACARPAGDSRAVLSRKGVAVGLTSDHKPDRKDEAVRAWLAASRAAHLVQGLLRCTPSAGPAAHARHDATPAPRRQAEARPGVCGVP